jgi:hypothetical protein
MNKRQSFIELELSGEMLESLVSSLRDKLLNEFWAHVPEGSYREQIKLRLEKNILASFDPAPDNTQST